LKKFEMPTYIDSAWDCFQEAQNNPWHAPELGRQADYQNLSLTLHYARLSTKAPYRSRGRTDEDAIARSAGEWWFHELREGDKRALTEAGISIDDFMKAKYQCDVRACFPDFCDLPDFQPQSATVSIALQRRWTHSKLNLNT
jgi:hypothetical protein